MRDARRGRFDVVLVWASDRIARSVKHFFDVLDELNRLNVEFISFREQIDTGGPLGRAVIVIIGAIAELERNLIIERVRQACDAPGSKAGTSEGSRSTSTTPPSVATAAGARVSARSPSVTVSQPQPYDACSTSTPQTWRNPYDNCNTALRRTQPARRLVLGRRSPPPKERRSQNRRVERTA